MTCIVGLKTDDRVIIGGDSSAVDESMIIPTHLQKVFKKDNFLIGYIDSFRMGQLLQYKLSIPFHKQRQSDLEYLATTFIDEVKECFNAGNFKILSEGQEYGGSFLVGYKKELYIVDYDFHVNWYNQQYIAIGIGSQFAYGSLYSSDHLSPEQRVQNALNAAAYFSKDVCGPFIIYSI